MHFGRPELNSDLTANMHTLEAFLKAIGAPDTQPVEKLTIKKEDIIPEDMKVVVLSI